jgi:hypothetical protein
MSVSIGRLFSSKKALAFLFLLLTTGGCAVAPVVLEKPRVTIVNMTGRPVQQIVYRECGKDSGDWSPLNSAALSSQYEAYFELPIQCADLQAVFHDGKIAGSQQNVKKRYPFHWVLR